MEWTTGIKILKVYFQIIHPGKAHFPISQRISALQSVPTRLTMGI